MIIGRDRMETIGLLDLQLSENLTKWDNASVPMRDHSWLEEITPNPFRNDLFGMHDPITTEVPTRKLSPVQTRYTVMERERSYILGILKDFRNILFGQQIVVHTDHANLTCKTQNSERLMRWRLYIEKYSPKLRYIRCENNTMAGALGRLEIMSEATEEGSFSKELRAELYYYSAETFSRADYSLNYGMTNQTQLKDKQLLTEKQKERKGSQYETLLFTAGNQHIPVICCQGNIYFQKNYKHKL